jgi:MFS family permease
MIELLPQAAALIFTFEGIGVLLFGTILGIILGALPGIGSTVAVAMVLPFTLTMSQAPAILLLLAIYAGSVYGGSVSAILINTPGTPQSAATCLDGYPMAKRGEAGLALGWSTVASTIGGLTSAVVLLLAAPIGCFGAEFWPDRDICPDPSWPDMYCFGFRGVAVKGVGRRQYRAVLGMRGRRPHHGRGPVHIRPVSADFWVQPVGGGYWCFCPVRSVAARRGQG